MLVSKIKNKTMSAAVKYGTYGFLSVMMAAQLSMASTAEKVDRKVIDAKKSTREMKRSLKKTQRNLTGEGNYAKDLNDSAGDAVDGLKDEAKHAKKYHFGTKKGE